MRWLIFVLCALAACGGDDTAPEGGVDGATESSACASPADCDDGNFCNGLELCTPGAPGADMRGCSAAAAPACLAGQTCDEAADMCMSDCGSDPDADGDGEMSLNCGGADCDDADPQRYPGNTEICDAEARDEDCDPTTFGERDGDGDGAFDNACCNENGDTMRCGTDCNDAAPSVNPTSPEVCDQLDNDCDMVVDEGVAPIPCYPDPDMDGYAAMDAVPMDLCVCPAMFTTRAPVDAANTDCGEGDPLVFPGAVEACDRVDSDCSSGGGVATDEDADDDGFTAVGFAGCAGGFPATDCNDDLADVNPSRTEFRTEGYCAAGLVLCDCRNSGSSAYVCAPTMAACPATCTAGTPAANFDWDCSGAAELVSTAVQTTCQSPLMCSSSSPNCGQNGFSAAPTTADCGKERNFIRCFCSGSPTGNCVLRPPLPTQIACR